MNAPPAAPALAAPGDDPSGAERTALDATTPTPAVTLPDTSGRQLLDATQPSYNDHGDAPPSFAEATAADDTNAVQDVLPDLASVNLAPAPPPVLDSRIVFRVGEKQFFTTRATVAESQLLVVLLSTEATHNGEYFLDADPDTFAQILRFLRTRRFPLFYDQITGHDMAKYLELLGAAHFYQVPTLVTWLTAKRYLEAVVVKSDHKVYSLFGADQITRMHQLCWARDEHARVLTILERKDKVHICPARLWRHDGNVSKCMSAGCLHSQLRNPNNSSNKFAVMRVLDITALVTKIEIREAILNAGAYSDGPPPYQGDNDDD